MKKTFTTLFTILTLVITCLLLFNAVGQNSKLSINDVIKNDEADKLKTQIERELVLLEIGTGTWCLYCTGAAKGADELVAAGYDVAVIEYHYNDDFTNEKSDARQNYYNIQSYPTAHFDGTNVLVGGHPTQSMFTQYLGRYNQQINNLSNFKLDANFEYESHKKWKVDVEVEMVSNYQHLENNLAVQVVLTESDIFYIWHGLPKLNFVCRDMQPDENGTSVDFSSNPVQNVSVIMPIPDDYVFENCEIVVFIQDMDTKEVLQTTFAKPLESSTVELPQGFKFVSTNIIPEDSDMMSVLENNLNDDLCFVRNSNGSMLRKIGPNWVNGIGNWITTEGYLFKMNADDELEIQGYYIDPSTEINLYTGFQFVSYLPENQIDAMDAFASIINENLEFIRNSYGQTLRKIGPNWVNGIGNGIPGEGYLVKMLSDDILVYPEN